MTWALCFHCGETKFGAICPCEKCGVGSTGDISLDIAFSDHRLSEQTLKAFGDVIRAIRRVCDEDELCFWSLVYYVSLNHPDVLGVKLAPEVHTRCAEVLARASPPEVKVEESERAKMMKDLEANEDQTEPAEHAETLPRRPR